MQFSLSPQKNTVKAILPQIVFLRAVASLSVCLFHLYCGNTNLFSADNPGKHILQYGYLGVPVFFVISGFIICYSLPPDYNRKMVGTFFSKRIVRIEPPYLLSIILVLAIRYSAALVTHNPVDFSWKNLAFHFIYLNNFNLGTYYNVVYWTLGIEFQFYILIGLTYLFISRSKIALWIALIICLSAPSIPTGNLQLITGSMPIFGLGIGIYFYRYRKAVSLPVFLLFVVLYLIIIYRSDTATFYACCFATFSILYWNYTNAIITFLSRISYSLYLVHVPFGGTLINLGLRFAHTIPQRYLLFLVVLALTLIFAWLFNLIVERPFVKLAQRIQYPRD